MKTIEIELEPHYELLADLSEVSDRILASVANPLDHQIKTCQYQQDYDLVLNTFPTGTGKTKAALLYLLNNPKAKTLFIAPTNELIDQHYEDVKEFIKSSNLTHLVCKADARVIRGIDPDNDLYRQGERFYRLITNPLEFAEQLGIPEDQRSSRAPIILVTNPDLFYYSLYACYGRLDKRNLFETMFGTFDYIIIDEFHYYNAKQLANFLFFLALSLEFGYFDAENRKVCLLSATPDAQVYKYLERLSSQGLKWKEVSPVAVTPNNSRAVRTLSPVNLKFCESDDLDSYLITNANGIKERIQNSLDGALISYSLIDVNRAVGHLKKSGLIAEKDFGRITGAVSRRERKESAKKPLIVATPTVDIGYNFVKQAKTRQNLDFVVFTAKYADEFWQRIGRTGRVLGKPENNIKSEAIALVSSEIFAKLQNQLEAINTPLSREQLKNLLLTPSLSVFPQKPFLNEYISSFSMLESFRPLYELRQQTRSEERIKEVFERVREIFAPNSKRGYREYVGSIVRFNSLQASKNNETYSDQLIREFLSSVLSWKNQDNLSDDSLFNQFKNVLKAKKTKSVNEIKNYIFEEYFALQSLFSFRDSFQSLSCAIHDPHNVISDSESVVYYDLFHLLKYYNLHWDKSRKEFLETCNPSTYINEADLYCQVKSYKEKEDNLIISFKLDTHHEKELFDRRYCDKPIAINNLSIMATKKDRTLVPLSPSLTDAIKDQYITCLLFPEQGGALGDIQSRTRNMQINYPLVEVTFSDSRIVKYHAVMGTNAYILGSRIQKYLYALEKKLEYWIA